TTSASVPTTSAPCASAWRRNCASWASSPEHLNPDLKGAPSTVQRTITGKAYVLGDNIDTDQIIPAQYLTFNPAIPEEYRQFGKSALGSVPAAQAGLPKGHVPFHTDDEFVSPFKLIVAGRNFGCGSSREHAPIALDAAGIEAVVAEFYARIFFRNAVNGGYLIPFDSPGPFCDLGSP